MSLDFLYELTAPYYSKEGHSSIDPVVFFKFMLVGYMENISSDRAIIRTSSMRMDILYFVGYDIDEPLPWHSTLSRTRQLYGADVFRELFKKVLGLCVEKGMVSGRRQSVDSVLVKSDASMDSLQPRELVVEITKYTEELTMHEQASGENHSSSPCKEDKPPTPLKVSKVCSQEERTKPLALKKRLSNKSYYSPTDPDAKISTKPGKPRQLNYLGQMSVDIASHVITHIQADHADKRDSTCLEGIVERTMENLDEQGLLIEQVVCDGNYSSGPALKYLEDRGITAYIPNPGGYKTHRTGFSYDEEGDYYQCSEGKQLPFKGIVKDSSSGQQYREYRSSRLDCTPCPLRKTCIGKSNHKQIKDTVDKAYFDRMQERLKTSYARYMKRKRLSTVEPVIGSLVDFNGMKRVRTKGIAQADKCMIMAATAYNIKKWLKYKVKPAKSGAMNLKEHGMVLVQQLINELNGLVEKISRSSRKENTENLSIALAFCPYPKI